MTFVVFSQKLKTSEAELLKLPSALRFGQCALTASAKSEAVPGLKFSRSCQILLMTLCNTAVTIVTDEFCVLTGSWRKMVSHLFINKTFRRSLVQSKLPTS